MHTIGHDRWFGTAHATRATQIRFLSSRIVLTFFFVPPPLSCPRTMRDEITPSFTAKLVASMRGCAARLPATKEITPDDVSWRCARARLPPLYDK